MNHLFFRHLILNKADDGGSGGGTPPTVEELQQQLADEREANATLKGTNERLLEESKGFKEKWQDLKDEVQEQKDKALLDSGDDKAIAESERQKRLDAEQKAKDLETKLAEKGVSETKSKILSAIRKDSPNVREADLKLLSESTEFKSLLQTNVGKGELEGVESYLKKQKEDYPSIFPKQRHEDTDYRSGDNDHTKVDLSKMTREERKEHFKKQRRT